MSNLDTSKKLNSPHRRDLRRPQRMPASEQMSSSQVRGNLGRSEPLSAQEVGRLITDSSSGMMGSGTVQPHGQPRSPQRTPHTAELLLRLRHCSRQTRRAIPSESITQERHKFPTQEADNPSPIWGPMKSRESYRQLWSCRRRDRGAVLALPPFTDLKSKRAKPLGFPVWGP